jgi:hypothetical protein
MLAKSGAEAILDCPVWTRANTSRSCPRLVMRGQKRVEDARERAYDPRIHRKKRFIQGDGLPGQARQ